LIGKLGWISLLLLSTFIIYKPSSKALLEEATRPV